MTSGPPTSSQTSLQAVEAVLERLVSEWREARNALGLTAGSPWSEVAAALDVDRGSAQRLVRVGRLPDTDASVLEHLPGPQGWHAVVRGLERRLGAEHRATQRLAAAVDAFARCLSALGGSKAAARRALGQLSRGGAAGLGPGMTARSRWVESAAEAMGYVVETRLNLQIVRRNPDDAARIDVAMVNVFLGCTGSVHAMPFALSRYGSRGSGTTVSGSDDDGAHAFFLLEAATSSPPPSLLATADEERQTVFIEPTWGVSGRPLDVGILQRELSALPSPWTSGQPLLVLSVLNRHPTRRLIVQSLVHPDVLLDSVVRFAGYRDLASHGQTRHWFDRLPEPAQLQTWGPGATPADPEPFASYGDILAEVESLLGWGLEAFAGSRADVLLPVPLARYSMEFERTS